MVAVMVQVTGCCLYRSCVKTQTVTRAGTRALTLHCATTGHPVAPGTSATLAWHPSQQHGPIENSHIPTHHPEHRDGKIKTVCFHVQSIFICIFCFKTDICSNLDISILDTFQDFASMGQFALVTRHEGFFRERFD